MRKDYCKGEEHELPRGPLKERSSLSSPLESSPTQLHCVKATTDTADMLGNGAVPLQQYATTRNLENQSVSTGSQYD
jgi:hypothetical protein